MDARGPSMFHQASVTNNGTIYATVNDQQDRTDHLLHLHSFVATNAILNAGGRADTVQCFPGTRKQVISDTEDWISVGYREDRGIFWLRGPAGAGKSAIVQTIAENCIKREMETANFFFFRADRSRNHSGSVVATLLHQLLERSPALASSVNEIISKNPLVFRKTLSDQFKLLLDGPVRSLRQGLPPQPPIIFLIDGLDECDSQQAHLSLATRTEQTTLLNALHELVTAPDSPFIALVASRIESHIQMAFNQLDYAAASIDLNDDEESDNDIRRYVTAELVKIRRTHPLGGYMDASWPDNSVIDSIVEKASGQFIYAAVVIRFLANSPQSPAITMEMVQQIRPIHKRSPFSEIDAVYTFILSRAEHWQSASEIVALCKLSPFIKMSLLSLFYSEHEVPSYFCDLTSILQAKITANGITIMFYHASFNDFIHNRERAGRFHIDLTYSAQSFAPQLILAISDFYTFRLAVRVLKAFKQNSESLTHALTHLPLKPVDVDWSWTPGLKHDQDGRDVKDDFLALITARYATHAPDVYRKIVASMKHQGWIPHEVLLEDTLSVSKPLNANGRAIKQRSDVSLKPADRTALSVWGGSGQPQTSQSHASTQQPPLSVANVKKWPPGSDTNTIHYDHGTYASLHPYLAPHGIAWDVRDAPGVITRPGDTISESSRRLLEPCCDPPKLFVHIILTTKTARLPWNIRVYACRPAASVTLAGVFKAVYTTLRVNITPGDWALLQNPQDQARAARAYQARYRRCHDQAAYSEEKRAGMKRVDFLIDCYRWVGLEQSKKQSTVWVLRIE